MTPVKIRFDFGKNWRSFSSVALNRERVDQARKDFNNLFSGVCLKGKRFLDIGFGQGLSLFFAQELDANVQGIDIDSGCVEALQHTALFFSGLNIPEVQIASILDSSVVNKLGVHSFDIVHSWGVLHHTGTMWQAIDNASDLVSPEGHLVMSIYNSHWSSPIWRFIKYFYNVMPHIAKKAMIALLYPPILFAKWTVTRRNPFQKQRGMDFHHDVIDWVGGYPYEYATKKMIEEHLSRRGFNLTKFIASEVPTGCNEFVFEKEKRSGGISRPD